MTATDWLFLYVIFGLALTLWEIVRMPTHFYSLRKHEALIFIAAAAAAWPLLWSFFYWQLWRRRPAMQQRRRTDWP